MTNVNTITTTAIKATARPGISDASYEVAVRLDDHLRRFKEEWNDTGNYMNLREKMHIVEYRLKLKFGILSKAGGHYRPYFGYQDIKQRLEGRIAFDEHFADWIEKHTSIRIHNWAFAVSR
jgi:hypothetical protein